MASVSHTVEAYLQSDGIAQEAMRRGIVNQRALARWMIEQQEWDVSEDAVQSALRRHGARAGESPLEPARGLLARSRFLVRTGLSVLTLRQGMNVTRRFSQLAERVEDGSRSVLRVVRGEQDRRVVVDKRHVEQARDALGEAAVSGVEHGVTEFRLLLPEESRGVPGVIASISQTLAFRGITILEMVVGASEHLVLVPSEQTCRAYEALASITAVGECR